MLNTTVALTPAACVAIPYAIVNIESISCDREMVRSRKEVGGGKGQRQGTEARGRLGISGYAQWVQRPVKD